MECAFHSIIYPHTNQHLSLIDVGLVTLVMVAKLARWQQPMKNGRQRKSIERKIESYGHPGYQHVCHELNARQQPVRILIRMHRIYT